MNAQNIGIKLSGRTKNLLKTIGSHDAILVRVFSKDPYVIYRPQLEASSICEHLV